MTTRLYYTDPYQTTFSARVTRCDPHERSARVILDQTAFYPDSGGQPHDTGMLGDGHVIAVDELEDCSIGHIVDRDLPLGFIEGTVDWERRFDHMQQHTGQHVLSAAFAATCAARTESFHMSGAVSTIDLGAALDAAAIGRAEDEANGVVWEDRPVHVRFASAEEAAGMNLRKESARAGSLRLVDVEGYDLSACGGTHVARTGAIGMIAVTGWERYKGGTRVSFACGGRALRAFTAMRDVQGASIRRLSVHPNELPGAIDRLQHEGRELARRVREQQERLADFEASRFRGRATPVGARRIVVEALDGWDGAGLKRLATAVAAEPGHAVALVSASEPRLLVITRSADVALDAGKILEDIVARFGGRGGGRPELAQGGGMSGTDAELMEALRTSLAGP